jgi:hypothetical protein
MRRDYLFHPSQNPSSEPIVGRSLASIHVVTLLLTALLAWPWNVVLLAAESIQIANQVRLETVHVQAKSRVQRILRFGRWNQPSCSVIAPDYDRDEEDGDDGSPFSSSSIFYAIRIHPHDSPSYFSFTLPVLPDRTAPWEQSCHLRC